MKTLFSSFLGFILLLLLSGCSSGKYTVFINGDEADVKLKNEKKFSAEIVSISDTEIFFASIPPNTTELPKLFYSLKKDIKSIEVQGYTNSGWIAPVLLFQVLPVGLLAVAAANEKTNFGPVILLFSIPAIITSTLFGLRRSKLIALLAYLKVKLLPS